MLRATDIDDDGHIRSDGAARSIPQGVLNAKRLIDGDLILEASGGSTDRPVGRVAYFDRGADRTHYLSSNFFKTLRPAGGVAPRYLFWKLHWFHKQPTILSLQQQTTGIINLKFQDYLDTHLSVPEQRAEQSAIARILDTLDTQIERTQALIAKLEQVKEGLLHDLLTRGVDENGELRPSAEEAPELYKESALGLIPNAWSVVALGDCAEVVSGITLSSKTQTSNGILVPYLRVANVQDGHIDLSDLKHIRVSVAELQSLRLQPGDVLMNEGGDFDKLGRGAVWAGQVQDCIHQNHVFRVRTDPSRLNPDFLAAFAASQIGKRFFIRASKQSTNLASINSTQLKGMPVAAAPMAEQLIIVERIRSMNGVSQRHQDSLKALSLCKSGLMDDLLTGRVRVTSLLDPQETLATV